MVSDRAGDGGEHAAGLGAEEADGGDADDGDEGEHQAVLDHRGPVFVRGELPGGGDELGHGTCSFFWDGWAVMPQTSTYDE
jgi:hypothetical protein